jgi:hypothetical protein
MKALKILAAVVGVLLISVVLFPSFVKWHKEFISDNSAWSFYLESYDNGKYTFRHGGRTYVTTCEQKDGIWATGEQVQLQCNTLKAYVGEQLSGAMDVTLKEGQLSFAGFKDISMTIRTIR